MIKERMDFMMNTLRGRVSSDLDDLVHHNDSLLTTPVILFPLPPKFCMSKLETYDESKVLGSKDLGFYVFRTLMCIVGKP